MRGEELSGPEVDAVIHLKGDTPLMAKVGGLHVLLVPPGVTDLSSVVDGLPFDGGIEVQLREVDDPVVYGPGDVQYEKSPVERRPTKYGPGDIPAKVQDPTVVDVDKLLERARGPIVSGESNRQLRVHDIAHVVLPPEQLD